MLQREVDPMPSQKTDATAAFLASLEEPKLTSLAEAGKKPPIEILPPGMMSLSAPISIQKKPVSAAQNLQAPPGKPLALEAPATTTVAPPTGQQQSDSTPPPVNDPNPPQATSDSTPAPEAAPPPPPESVEAIADDKAVTSAPVSDADPTTNQETIEATATSNPAPAGVPPQASEVQETNVPTTVPLSDSFI